MYICVCLKKKTFKSFIMHLAMPSSTSGMPLKNLKRLSGRFLFSIARKNKRIRSPSEISADDCSKVSYVGTVHNRLDLVDGLLLLRKLQLFRQTLSCGWASIAWAISSNIPVHGWTQCETV